MTYEEFVRGYVEGEVNLAGGIAELEKESGVDHGIISRILSGKYVPSEKTFRRWFPDISIDFEVKRVIEFK